MTREAIATSCTVWRSDGPLSTTEGRLELTTDGVLRFVVDDAPAWEVDASTIEVKSPWYSFGASLRIRHPDAGGLFMAYPPKNRGTVGNAIDTSTARERLKHFKARLARTG